MYDSNTFAYRTQPRGISLLPWATEVVEQHEHALLFREGRLVGALPAGVHRLWGRHVRVQRLDRRRRLLEVPAQELATADGVTLKVTAQVAWSISDPVAAVSRDADHGATLYAAAQQAVRAAISGRTLERLAGERAAIAAELEAAIASETKAIGLTIHSAAVKDVMVNAETRKALAAAVLARHEGLAGLEKARGEHAALRALGNAARLLADQPALAQLKGLQVLAEGLRAGAQVVVTVGEGGMVPLGPRAKSPTHPTS